MQTILMDNIYFIKAFQNIIDIGKKREKDGGLQESGILMSLGGCTIAICLRVKDTIFVYFSLQ